MWFIVTHSVLSFSSQQNLDVEMSIAALKRKLFSVSGTEPQDMRLQLFNGRDELLCEMDSDEKTLAAYEAQEFYRIHVIDKGDTGSAVHGLEDTGQVEKYQISEDSYNKREDTFRKWKERNIKKADTSGVMTPQEREQEELRLIQEKGVNVGSRCEVIRSEDDLRPRGEIAYVGKVKFATGYWIGVKLDEPMGKNDGSVKGQRYFICMDKYGSFVKPDKINVGDQYTEIDLFDDDDDDDDGLDDEI